MKATLIALVLIVTATVTTAYGLVHGSLSMLDGTESLDGLADEVTVDRDDLGVVTIRGKTRADVARAPWLRARPGPILPNGSHAPRRGG